MELVSAGFFIAHGAASIALGLLIREEVYEELSEEHISEYEKRKEEEKDIEEKDSTKD